MSEKFNPQTWLLGTLLTLTLLFGGAAYTSQASALQTTTETVSKHAERIAKLESITQQLAELLKEIREERQRDRRYP